VNAVEITEKNPPTTETPLATFIDPAYNEKASKRITPATLLLVFAEAAKLLAPPTRVRLLTPPNVPNSEKEEATDALRGRSSVAPEDTVMVAVCAVRSSRAAYAHS
jgi:hypothetical protein